MQMTSKKMGLTLFWIGAIYAFISAIPLGAYLDSSMRDMTMGELRQTIWTPEGFWFNLWGLSPPLGALLAGIGLLLYSGAAGSRVWAFGIGIAMVVSLGMALALAGHSPPLFGVGGSVIVLCFLGILWFWAKERMALDGASTAGADFRLVGYVFFFIAAWFTCGAAAWPFLTSFAGTTPTSPMYVMVCLAMGWLFLFLSQYRARTPQGPEEARWK
jgi:hypothetical protein